MLFFDVKNPQFNCSKNHRFLTIAGISGALVSSILLWGNVAKADLKISPITIETEINRGQAQGTITATNGDAKDFRARVYTQPFTYDVEEGIKFLDSSPQDLAPYLQFSPRELEVPGNDERRIRFLVRVPPSLPDGEYRTMLFTENLEATIQEENNPTTGVIFKTSIVPRIGVAVYVRKGKISHNLTVVKARFNTQNKKLQLLAKNTGKASVIVQGNWVIKQGNKEIYKGLGMDTTVIAENERYINVDYSTSANPLQLKSGEYELSGHLGWGVNRIQKTPFTVKFTVP